MGKEIQIDPCPNLQFFTYAYYISFECKNKSYFFDINELSSTADLSSSRHSGPGTDLILLMVSFVHCTLEEPCWFLPFVVAAVKGKKIARLNY